MHTGYLSIPRPCEVIWLFDHLMIFPGHMDGRNTSKTHPSSVSLRTDTWAQVKSASRCISFHSISAFCLNGCEAIKIRQPFSRSPSTSDMLGVTSPVIPKRFITARTLEQSLSTRFPDIDSVATIPPILWYFVWYFVSFFCSQKKTRMISVRITNQISKTREVSSAGWRGGFQRTPMFSILCSEENAC